MSGYASRSGQDRLLLESAPLKLISQAEWIGGVLMWTANAITKDDGATWRSTNSAKPSWRMIFDPTNDRVRIDRSQWQLRVRNAS